MKAFIDSNFRLMDVNNDGVIGIEEFRYNAIQRLATDEIKIVDDAFNSLLNVSNILFLYSLKLKPSKHTSRLLFPSFNNEFSRIISDELIMKEKFVKVPLYQKPLKIN